MSANEPENSARTDNAGGSEEPESANEQQAGQPRRRQRRTSKTRGVAGLLGDYTEREAVNDDEVSDHDDTTAPEHDPATRSGGEPGDPQDPSEPQYESRGDSATAGAGRSWTDGPHTAAEAPASDEPRAQRPTLEQEGLEPTRDISDESAVSVTEPSTAPTPEDEGRRPRSNSGQQHGAEPDPVETHASTKYPVPSGDRSPLARHTSQRVVKVSYYIPEDHTFVLDEMRAQLKRRYRYSPRQASQSNLVALAIERLYEDLMGEPFAAEEEQGDEE